MQVSVIKEKIQNDWSKFVLWWTFLLPSGRKQIVKAHLHGTVSVRVSWGKWYNTSKSTGKNTAWASPQKLRNLKNCICIFVNQKKDAIGTYSYLGLDRFFEFLRAHAYSEKFPIFVLFRICLYLLMYKWLSAHEEQLRTCIICPSRLWHETPTREGQTRASHCMPICT